MRIKTLLGAALLCAAATAHSNCIVGDHSSVNKSVHLVGLMAADLVVTNATQSEAWGVSVAASLGSYREIWKVEHRSEGYNCEYSSMAYDLAGILAAHWVIGRAHVIVAAQPGGVAVTYSREF